MKKNLGFTLVEMVIVIVIIGILSMVAVPIYRGHVEHSIAVEGRALLAEVSAAQEIYNARAKEWYTTLGNNVTTNTIGDLGIDSRRNKYFREFSWDIPTSTANEFKIYTTGAPGTKAEKITITLVYHKEDPSEFFENKIK